MQIIEIKYLTYAIESDHQKSVGGLIPLIASVVYHVYILYILYILLEGMFMVSIHAPHLCHRPSHELQLTKDVIISTSRKKSSKKNS